MPEPKPTPAQEATLAEINNNYGVAEWRLLPSGVMAFTADDGDDGWIDQAGSWDWD